jgi:hypothetical protein
MQLPDLATDMTLACVSTICNCLNIRTIFAQQTLHILMPWCDSNTTTTTVFHGEVTASSRIKHCVMMPSLLADGSTAEQISLTQA